MSIIDDIIDFGKQHADLAIQIESLGLDEAMALIKMIAPTHPLFVQIAQAIVDLLDKQIKGTQ